MDGEYTVEERGSAAGRFFSVISPEGKRLANLSTERDVIMFLAAENAVCWRKVRKPDDISKA